MKYILIIATAILLSAANPSYQLNIKIIGIQPLKGTIEIALYDNEDTFLDKGEEFKTYSVKADKQNKNIIIDKLPKGTYAICLYHDKNGDGKCNTNALGVPKEGYGFSNNIKPKIRKPSFSDCSLQINGNTKTTISVMY